MNTTSEGLRDRKKAKRRQDIIDAARALFADKGFEATTMADIAEAVAVSPPTVFNYFGTKDAILVAMIAEGIALTHDRNEVLPPLRTDADFATIIVDLFVFVTTHTLQIAPPAIWRYAEASVMRHPDTDLSREYGLAEDRLVRSITAYLAAYDIRLLNGTAPDHALLAQMLHDIWNLAFFRLIRSDAPDLDAFKQKLHQRIAPLMELVLTPDTILSPLLK